MGSEHSAPWSRPDQTSGVVQLHNSPQDPGEAGVLGSQSPSAALAIPYLFLLGEFLMHPVKEPRSQGPGLRQTQWVSFL